MNSLLLASALAWLAWMPAAHASLVSVTFTPFGNGVLPPSVPAGSTPVDFTTTDLTFTGNAGLVTGSTTYYAAPAFSTSTVDTSPYLAVQANATATLTLPEETGVQLYVGSLDAYNQLTFSNSLSYTGAQLASMVSGLADSGCQTCGDTNGYLSFTFTPGKAVSWVTLSTDGSDAFEVAGVGSSGAVPELSTWAMMALGFAGLGYVGSRRSKTSRALFAGDA